jgi:hypothetical protein
MKKQVTLTRFFKRKEPLIANDSNTPKTPQKESVMMQSTKSTPRTPSRPLEQDSDEDDVQIKRIKTDKENERHIVDSDDDFATPKKLDLEVIPVDDRHSK